MRWQREIAESRPQFGELRNASHPTAASHSAWVSTHQTHINLDGDCVKIGNFRGVVVTSRFRGPNSAKYAMRSSPQPHDFQLTSPRTKRTPPSTLMLSKQGIAPSTPENRFWRNVRQRTTTTVAGHDKYSREVSQKVQSRLPWFLHIP